MYTSRLFLPLALLFYLSGCSQKTPSSKAVYVQIKSPNISISDAGFLTKTGDSHELTVLDAGNAMFKLSLNHLACLNSNCGTRLQMLNELGIKQAPVDLLDSLLENRPTSDNSCVLETSKDGFIQICTGSSRDMTLTSIDKGISFIDKTNKIFIKIMEIDK